MIFEIDLPFKLVPKPRGKLAKNGYIYHNDRNYREYKKRVAKAVLDSLGKIELIDRPCYLGLFSQYTSHAGRQPDFLDNQLGSLLDAIVSCGLIEDDSRGHLYGNKTLCIQSSIDYSVLYLATEYIEISLIDNKVQRSYDLIKFKCQSKRSNLHGTR